MSHATDEFAGREAARVGGDDFTELAKRIFGEPPGLPHVPALSLYAEG